MSFTKRYYCSICKSTPDQISHHKDHLHTQKHKDKTEIFNLKLNNLSQSDLIHLYKTIDINKIIQLNETISITDNNTQLSQVTATLELVAPNGQRSVNYIPLMLKM